MDVFLPVKTVCVLVNRGYHPQTKHFVESGSAPEDRDGSLSVITSSDMKKQLFGKTEQLLSSFIYNVFDPFKHI